MSDKIRQDLFVLLPDVPDEKDRCVRRLTDRLNRLKGVKDVHITDKDTASPQLCIHYDRSRISLNTIHKRVRQAGADITGRYGHFTEDVTGLYHERRARVVSDTLLKIDGILDSEASSSGTVNLEYDSEKITRERIFEELAKLNVHPINRHRRLLRKRLPRFINFSQLKASFRDHLQLIFALTCGAFLLSGWIFSYLEPRLQPYSLPLLLAAYAFGSYFTLIQVYQSLRIGKFNIDLLMLVAAAGAAILGAWIEGALLLFLFSLGHALEHYAMGRARKAIEALSDITPDTAVVMRNGDQVTVAVDELQPGDWVLVKPGERFPADGFVMTGSSSVDQAAITGESMPVDKAPVSDPNQARKEAGDIDSVSRIFAGTLNGNHAMEVEVLTRTEDSTMARMVKLVKEAETHKSPTQRFAVRFERIFVPVILAFVLLLMFAWTIIDEPFSDSFYRAMAVLVASSPCALAISTPSAVLSGVARAARMGVLVKGGAPLEELGRLRAMAFDKTGTLTAGRPRITDVITADGVNEQTLLSIAVSIERQSDHPLAKAVVRDGVVRLGSYPIPGVQQVEAIPGKGMQAKINGRLIAIGALDLFSNDHLPAAISDRLEELQNTGRTTVLVRDADRFLGIIGLMDTPRKTASEVIHELRALDIRRLVLISGDHQRVADSIANEIGLDEAMGNLLPEQKVDAILRLLKEEQLVGMVGDGVNDAPAMANATIGIAMGAAGSDVALETADIALMADDLTRLPSAVGLSRWTRQIIRQNLWISLGMIAFLVPVTMMGLATIGIAVLLHEGSTLVVVLNALRLLGYKAA
ncbi:MAG: heavy metal translocating P-type ATPase [Balneolales bacterium]